MGCLSILAVIFGGVFFLFGVSVDSGSEEFSEPVIVETSVFVNWSALPQSRTDDGAFLLGEADAPITIILFEDPACPACQNYEPTVERIVADYVLFGDAALEYRTLVTAGRERTVLALNYAECAEEAAPGSFWTVRDRLFDAAINGFYDDAPNVVALSAGVDVSTLMECLPTADQVEIDGAYAASLGASSTPSVYYRIGDGDPLPVPDRTYAGLAALIESAQ